MTYSRLPPSFRTFTIAVGMNISRNVQKALKDPKRSKVVHKEMRGLIDNDTWDVVGLPENKKIERCKWVSTVKYKSDDSINGRKKGW